MKATLFRRINQLLNPLELEVFLFTQKFKDKETESQYQERILHTLLDLQPLYYIWGCSLFAIFIVITPPSPPFTIWALAILLIPLVLAYLLKRRLYIDKITSLSNIGYLLIHVSYVLIFYFIKDDKHLQMTYFTGLPILILGSNFFFRLRLLHLIILNLIVFLVSIYVYAIMLDLYHVDPRMLQFILLYLLASIILIWCISYHSEYLSRTFFIKQQVINQQQQQLLHINQQIEQRIAKKVCLIRQERNLSVRSLLVGQEIERQRIAADLHDTLSVELIHIKRGIEQLYADTEDTPLLEEVDFVINQIREISNNLTPFTLEVGGLVAAIRENCAKMDGVNGMKIRVSTSASLENKRLDKLMEAEIFRITKEITANALRHSDASRLTIRIFERKACLRIVTSDNGKGLLLDDTPHGNGLRNIRHRVELLQGTFEMHSQPNFGTSIVIVIPKNY